MPAQETLWILYQSVQPEMGRLLSVNDGALAVPCRNINIKTRCIMTALIDIAIIVICTTFL